MRVFTHHPEPPLSELVELLWLVEGERPDRGLERVLPTGEMQLMVAPPGESFVAYDRAGGSERRYEDALFCGASSEPVVIDPATPASILGVRFTPAGAFPFLGCSAGDLGNTDVPLRELWGCEADELGERLHAASRPSAKFRLLEGALLRLAAGAPEPHPAVGFALREFRLRPRRIAEVVGAVGLSSRRFADLFREQVGLTPKLYCRVRRFQRVLGSITRRRPIAWSQLALDCGYFDQSHLNRDFKLFSGLTPTAYLGARGKFQNHVPLPG